MAKYIVSEFHPTWVKEFYEVEADNPDEAEEAYWDGNLEYLGHNLSDRIEGRDPYGLVANPAENDALPFIDHPAKGPPLPAPDVTRNPNRCEVCEHAESEGGALSSNAKHESICDDCLADPETN